MSASCNEILESLLLFMRLQNSHMSKSTLKQLNPSLHISIHQQLPEEETQNLLGYDVHVLCSGLGAYFVDGRLFLNTLCEHGEALRHLLKSTADCTESGVSLLQLKTRRIGDCLHMSCFKIEGFSSTDEKQPVIREWIDQIVDHLHSTSLLLSYKMTFSSLEEFKSETHMLSSHLHLLHIINPQVSMRLVAKDVSKVEIFHVEFEMEPFKVLTKTPFKLATSLQHFIEHKMIPSGQSKLYMLKGDTYTIPGSIGTMKSSFKVYSTAAVVPHLQLRNKKKIPANKLCKQLHIFVLGPFNTPLISTSSQVNFPLSCLAEWESYGMSVRVSTRDGRRHLSSMPELPSIFCELSNTRSIPSFPSSISAGNHVLAVFIFLEESTQRHKSFTGDSNQWKCDMELLHQLRIEFQNFVVTHSRKFQSSVHSVLNKLICNYGSHAKTSNVMSVAIPLITDAVASIVMNSSDEEFKRKCRELTTEMEDDSNLKSYVNQKLWKMARDKLQVTDHLGPSSCNPDEPTSPEIMQVTSNSTSTDTLTNTNVTSATDEIEDEHLTVRSPETLTDNQTDPVESEGVTDFVCGHTLSTTTVLQTRLLSRAVKREIIKEDVDDCFNALESVDVSIKTKQQTKDYHKPKEIMSTQIVQQNLMGEENSSVGHDKRSLEDLSCVSKPEMLESTDLHCDDTQLISSPSLLNTHHLPVDTMVTSTVNNKNNNFDDLEYFNELCTTNSTCSNDTDSTVINDTHIMGPVSMDEESWSVTSDHPDSSEEQPDINDNSFTELEHFDDNASMCIHVQSVSPLPKQTAEMTDIAMSPLSNGFDELEYLSDDYDDSTCIDLHTMVSFRCEDNSFTNPLSGTDQQEQVVTCHKLKYNSEEFTNMATHHETTVANTESEQCLPNEEAGTYSSDEEWKELASVSVLTDSVVEPLTQKHNKSIIPLHYQLLEEDCCVPSMCCERDSFDQLELCEETMSMHHTTSISVVMNTECSVTDTDFDWD